MKIRNLEKLDLGKTECSLVNIRPKDAFEQYFFALARPECAAALRLKVLTKTSVGGNEESARATGRIDDFYFGRLACTAILNPPEQRVIG